MSTDLVEPTVAELIEIFQSAKANGNPTDYIAFVSVAQAHAAARFLKSLRSRVERLTAERDEAAKPPLTCPHIDAFIAKTSPPQDALDEFEAVRLTNSQLRYGIWAEKARADDLAASLATERRRVEELEDGTRPLVEAATGMSRGEDWNNGTHAKMHGYRQKLLEALSAAVAALAVKQEG